MLDIVAAHNDKPPLSVELKNIDNPKPRRSRPPIGRQPQPWPESEAQDERHNNGSGGESRCQSSNGQIPG
jgi:hypothetical protein